MTRDEELRRLLWSDDSLIRGCLTEVGMEQFMYMITSSDWLRNVKADELEEAAKDLNRLGPGWAEKAALYVHGRSAAIRNPL